MKISGSGLENRDYRAWGPVALTTQHIYPQKPALAWFDVHGVCPPPVWICCKTAGAMCRSGCRASPARGGVRSLHGAHTPPQVP
jgi:hypothetical protein